MLLDSKSKIVTLHFAVFHKMVLLFASALHPYLISFGPMRARYQLAVVVCDAGLVGNLV